MERRIRFGGLESNRGRIVRRSGRETKGEGRRGNTPVTAAILRREVRQFGGGVHLGDEALSDETDMGTALVDLLVLVVVVVVEATTSAKCKYSWG
jgi:hypothetical protein